MRIGSEPAHGPGDGLDEHGAGLEGAADEAHREGALEAGPADDGGDLLRQLGRSALVELACDRVAPPGELARLRGEGGDLALGERLGVDTGGKRLHAGDPEELDGRLAQSRCRAGVLTVAERRLDRLDAEPVAAALVAEQMPPAAGAPGAPAAGGICSATRAAATGSASSRSRRRSATVRTPARQRL